MKEKTSRRKPREGCRESSLARREGSGGTSPCAHIIFAQPGYRRNARNAHTLTQKSALLSRHFRCISVFSPPNLVHLERVRYTYTHTHTHAHTHTRVHTLCARTHAHVDGGLCDADCVHTREHPRPTSRLQTVASVRIGCVTFSLEDRVGIVRQGICFQ